jgi:hypothetical protein
MRLMGMAGQIGSAIGLIVFAKTAMILNHHRFGQNI